MNKSKLKKANSFRVLQEVLRNKALSKGVNLMAPETIFLSQDTKFGKKYYRAVCGFLKMSKSE